ncbi:dnaJ protein homolog [Musa acuminata AAA Group]|uniref:dnaJ protein homolog n=1 Tax=Musa acuminata AAA Group TaxID=214697 RepID=UPI0031DFF3E4
MFGGAPGSDRPDYYEILGVAKSANQDELKQAYKKAAMKNHPDKVGDAEKDAVVASCVACAEASVVFLLKYEELSQAYGVLSDPKKREIDDKYRKDALMGGEIIGRKDKCPRCKGKKVIQEKKLLEPDTVTGHIIVIVQLQEHPQFKRAFGDLYVEHWLSLAQAFCAFHNLL